MSNNINFKLKWGIFYEKVFSKKPVKVIISIFIVLVLIVCICNAVFASVALDFQKGVAVCDDQLKKLINRVEPNLILVGGDTVLTKWNDICTQQFCDFMEKFEIPWAPVFGNHDYEGRADKAKLAEIYEASEHCYYRQRTVVINRFSDMFFFTLKSKYCRILSN